ncbi:DsbA family protein [Candidatus Kapabacteria bacterium]|nr:DsbA family protein [Candidatus Kapabacteria bacterium]
MNQGKILYIFDPLCGWCYPMADVINKSITKYSNDFDFEIISGGMVLGERAGKIGEKFAYVNDAYKSVESHTGAKFGPAFLKELEKGELMMSSLEPSIALQVVKELDPSSAFKFAHSLQNALYFDGIDLTSFDNLLKIAKDNNVDENDFTDLYNSEDYSRKTLSDFEFASKLGVNGFPTILLEKNQEYYLIARGYQHFIDLNNIFRKIIKSNEETVEN